MLGKDVPSLDPIQVLNLFKKSYQKIQPDDLNKEWESFSKPEKQKLTIVLPEFKKGRSELYSKSFFKELDKLIKSKKENIRFFSSLFKEYLYVIFEDPPKFDESDHLVDVCLTIIQTFCILADTPSTEISELNKFYENAQIFIYIFALKCDSSEAQRIKDEKLAMEYNAKQFSLSQKNVLSPKKTSTSTRDSKLAQRTNSLSNSKPQADATVSKNLSASTSSTIKNQTKSESMNSKTSESTNSKAQMPTSNSKPQIPSASASSKSSSISTNPKIQTPSATSTKPKSPVSSSKNSNTQAPSSSATGTKPASTESKTQSSTSSYSKMSSVSIDPKDSSKSTRTDSKTQSSTKSTNSYSKISSVSIDPGDSSKQASTNSKAQSSAKSTDSCPKTTLVSKDPKTQTSAMNSSKPSSTDSKTQASSTKSTYSNSNLNSTNKPTTSNNASATNSKSQSHTSSSRLPSSRPDSRASLSRTGSVKSLSGSQQSQGSSINKLSPEVAESLKTQINCIIDLVKSNPKYKHNWDTIQSEFKSMSDKVHKYIKGTELENYCKKFNSNVMMVHTKERLELLVSCLRGIESLIHS